MTSYKEVKENAKKTYPSKQPPSPTANGEDRKVVSEKYRLGPLYDDLNDPTKKIPNRKQILKSLDKLANVEDRLALQDLRHSFKTILTEYHEIINAFLKITESILNLID